MEVYVTLIFKRNGKASGNARYEMTMAAAVHYYISVLFNIVYGQYSASGLKPWPNLLLPQHADKMVSQYHFNTRSIPLFTALHSLWYVWSVDSGSFIKIVPLCIGEMFGPITLAYWIMDDGYFEGTWCKVTLLCTDCYTKDECLLLQQVLLQWGIITTLNIRNKNTGSYRIRVAKSTMPQLIKLVRPHILPKMLYKLGL